MSTTTVTDPYRVLGVPVDADDQAIQRAYRKLMRTYHPDMPTGDASRAADISTAYAVLSDPARRAELDLDRRRATTGEQPQPEATARPTGSSTGTTTPTTEYSVPDTVPPAGPVRFRDHRPLDWVPAVLGAAALVASLTIGTSFLPVLAVTVLACVAAIVPARKVFDVPVHSWVLPAAAVIASTGPVASWLGTGTIPVVALAAVALGLAVAATVRHQRRLVAGVGFTQDARWIFTDGRPPHPFLAGLGNVTGWVGLTGSSARFDTALMNGRTVMLLATVRPTHPGETLDWVSGRLMRIRAGSTTAVPDPGLDLFGWAPATLLGLQVRYAVYVPGLPLGAGPDGDVPVLGEDDLLAWMSTVPTSRLERRRVPDVATLLSTGRAPA